jgi:uncharacterized protein YigE (DUF2233 family)
MNRWFALLGFLVLGIVASPLTIFLGSQSASAGSPCIQQSYQSASYIVCTVDLRAYIVRLFWKDQQQQPYAGFDHLPRRVEDGPIVFARTQGCTKRTSLRLACMSKTEKH